MLSVIIKNNGENSVIQLTYENLWKELKDIADAELIVSEDWFEPLHRVKNRYICFVEADCLVNSGYFTSMMGLFKKDPFLRKLAMLSSVTGVNDWANKFYGYQIGNNHADGIIPVTEKKSNKVYPIQIGYFPGSILRVNMLKELLKELKPKSGWQEDLVFLSTQISLGIWSGGIGDKEWAFSGNRVHINPNSTYVSTEDYVNDIGKFEHEGNKVYDLFKREGI